MSTIENDQISPYCRFNKIIKGPGTSFQSPNIESKTGYKYLSDSKLIFDQVSFWQDLGFKRNKHKSNFHYAVMLMMRSQILKFVDFTKTQKSRYLENELLFFLQRKKFVNYTLRATLLQKTVLQRR